MINFEKSDGLVPAIIQDFTTLKVLMLGYMNDEAYTKTINEGVVTFYSRSKQRLWTKGETSNNFLYVKELSIDCDNDTILIKVDAKGPTCHLGNTSCFNDHSAKGFLYQLEKVVHKKIDHKNGNSYTYKLFSQGINKIAQKVGEEAVELVIESKDDDIELFKGEAADLLYHFLILLKAKNISLIDIEASLQQRNS